MKEPRKNKFIITVGALLDASSDSDLVSKLNVADDLRMLKAALLYADKVQFHSYGASSLVALMNQPSNMNENERLDWFLNFYKDLGNPAHIEYVTDFIAQYRASKKNKRGNFNNYLRYKQAINKSFSDMKKISSQAGINGLNEALSLDLVEFQSYTRDGYDIEEYFEAISAALTKSETYPLLDDETGKLVQLAIKEKKITLLGTTEKRSKHIGLSSSLFERLPLFDNASVDEILDIRKELEKPLIRFRSEIMKYSAAIDSVPWENEFPLEIEDIFIEHIEPSILEIEEAYKTNKSLLDILPSAIRHKGFPASSAMGIALSQMSQFPETVVALSVIGGLTLGMYDAVKARREKLEEIKGHQLFFYYRAGKLLE